MIKKQQSYVLIFTLAALAFATVLTSQLMRMVSVGSKFDQAMIDRERAEMLALGGINLAITQLTIEQPRGKEEKLSPKEEKERKKKGFTEFLERTLPHMNRWQLFELKEEIDGIDGEVKICISCEDGKIDINKAFDFNKGVFKLEYEPLLKTLQLTKEKTKESFLTKLAAYLKKRKRNVSDLSELLEEPTLEITKHFYVPPERADNPKLSKPNTDLAIGDIFTIWGKNGQLEALFLSDALCSILNLRRPAAHDAKFLAEKFKQITKEFDPGLDQNQEKFWKIVRPIYEQKSSFKIKDRKIFSPKFEPRVYSVLSSGKVGTVQQHVLAIIKALPEKKAAKEPKAEEKKEEKEKKRTVRRFKVLRLYWI